MELLRSAWRGKTDEPASCAQYVVYAFQALSMEEFQKEMEGIYTTCVVPDTLDESPMAYKSMAEIIDQIEPTVEIVQRIRPVYNFKASD